VESGLDAALNQEVSDLSNALTAGVASQNGVYRGGFCSRSDMKSLLPMVALISTPPGLTYLPEVLLLKQPGSQTGRDSLAVVSTAGPAGRVVAPAPRPTAGKVVA